MAFKSQERKLSAVKINVHRFEDHLSHQKQAKKTNIKQAKELQAMCPSFINTEKRSMFSLKDFPPLENLLQYIAKYLDTKNPI